LFVEIYFVENTVTFAKITEHRISFEPTEESQIGIYDILVEVEDSDSEGSGEKLSVKESFRITIFPSGIITEN